ncbi:PaaI family thioesterase [Actibacterium sp. XHP0104]|uniref:PaaI family thioesterase n=1 Tax=Actibacterium sp. XHP0104 TaxID=2984335 RepID=UPI0021E87D1E|nr:PaaI family thioesterase [Actibacterium sp. XHP0104]MCV2880505.1 PaaI family thioesterase [Actibacterium sp. XHP0104]
MTEQTLTPSTRQRIEQSFAAQGLMQSMSARLENLAPGHCSLAAPVQPAFSQQHGFAHAAATFALGDNACGYAALSLLDDQHDVLTSEMKIHLLAPAQGVELVSRGEVIRPGRRLIITRADVHARDAEGRETHVATLLGTIIPMRLK